MAVQRRPAVFLDRDGVMNELRTEHGPRENPRTADEVVLLPGVTEALRSFRRLGVPLIVVTNQPNVAKGKSTWEDHWAIEARLRELLGPEAAVDAVHTCFHHPDPTQVVVPELLKACECRKPNPGLLLRAAEEHDINLAQSVMVGDAATDVEAGKRAGCWTVRLTPSWSPVADDEPPADAEAADLLAAVPAVVHFLAEALPHSLSPHVPPMKIFIDSGDLAEIKKYLAWGVCDGVTTNPTILLKAGVKSPAEMKARSQDIATLVAPRPLSVETTSDDLEEIARQVHEYVTWAPNVAVKITITNRKGGSLLPAITRHAAEGVRINVTAMTTLNQAILAAIALENGTRRSATKPWGPHFLSVFGGRISEEHGVGVTSEILKRLRRWLDLHHFTSEILVGSVRSPENIDSWAVTGAHILTIPPEVLAKSLLSGRTKETVVQFLEDARASLEAFAREGAAVASQQAPERVRV